jgi:2-keto-4-pentenoate hydratase/2-oxohepta-3-ene-1,7-dioic acid hydratase in catechol pathway
MRAFAAAVELRLYRNGDLKQSARQSEAIWDFDEILRRSGARAGTVWEFEGRSVGLPVRNAAIPARTGLLGGTPDGTILHRVNRSALMLGIWDWLGCGGREPLTRKVIERHIAQERRAKRYLQPGDRVHIAVDYLGEIDTLIVE